MIGRILGGVGILLASVLVVGAAGVHYVPRPNDGFAYEETISLGGGYGDYGGYTESTVINGSVTVSSVLPNGTDSAVYYNADSYQNDMGTAYRWTSSGPFSFSADSFLYVHGTDNHGATHGSAARDDTKRGHFYFRATAGE